MCKIFSMLIACLALVSLLATPPALAAEGRIPIWEPTVLDATTGAAISGKYIVTRNITAPGFPVVQIIGTGTEQVDIDLNGFTVSCAGGGANVIEATTLDSLTIRNGTVEEGLSGIYVESATRVGVADVRVESVSQDGIGVVKVANVAIADNVVVDAVGNGIFVNYVGASVPKPQASIEDNLVLGGGKGIVALNGSNTVIRNNQVNETASTGIEVSAQMAFQVVGNSVRGAEHSGINVFLGRAGRVQGNTVVETNGYGISLAVTDDCLVLDNVSSQNVEGLVVSGARNQVERNVLNANSGTGLYVNGSDNTFGRNTARGNMTVPAGGCPLTPPLCTPPDICIIGLNNTSFGDNMGPGPGC